MDKATEDITRILDIGGADLMFESLACNITDLDDGGDATELACIKLMRKCGYKNDEVKVKYCVAGRYERQEFDPNRKKMSTIIQKDSSVHRMYIKGNAEGIVASCKEYYSKDRVLPMTEAARVAANNEIYNFNNDALRTIAVAYKDLRPDEYVGKKLERDTQGNYPLEEDKLVLICLLGIRDTLRTGVIEAVELCKTAGIKVRMVTGDNLVTARAIARNCGILDNDHQSSAMEAKDFQELLGGLIKHCNGCGKDISNEDLVKYKDRKRLEDKKKKEEEELAKAKAKEEKGEGEEEKEKEGEDDDDEEAEIEKQDPHDECPLCEKKEVIDKVKDLEKFKTIYPYLCVLARSKPDHKLLLVTGLKEL